MILARGEPRDAAWSGYLSGHADGTPDAVPDKPLRLGEQIPAGPRDLAFLDAPDITICRRKGEPKVKVKMIWLILFRPCRNPAVLDVCGDLRQENHRSRVNAGLLHQLAFRRASQ